MQNSKAIVMSLPQQPEILKAFGAMAIRHSYLDYHLRMMIKSLTGVSKEDALLATKYQGSSELRERIKKLAKKRFGDGEVLVKIQALMQRAEELTEKRNDYMHSLWAEKLEEGTAIPVLVNENGNCTPTPSAEDLNRLSSQLDSLANEIWQERLHGFIFEALQNTNPA